MIYENMELIHERGGGTDAQSEKNMKFGSFANIKWPKKVANIKWPKKSVV